MIIIAKFIQQLKAKTKLSRMFDYNCIHLFVLFFTLKAKKAENNSAGNYFREHLSGVIL